MSSYTAIIQWNRKKREPFTDNRYSRGHIWKFDGGAVVAASASPQIVPLPFSIEANVDPEEAFVATISSCHMLFFLSIAAKRGYIVNSYTDSAVGKLTKSNGKNCITTVQLKPVVEFETANQPDKSTISEIHKESHKNCFIANSVKTKITIEI